MRVRILPPLPSKSTWPFGRVLFASRREDSNHVRKPPMWLSSTSSKTGRFLYFFLRPPQQKEMHANPSSAATINIHPLSGWFFIFGHSPCLLAAPKGANTVWHLRGAFYFTFVQSPLPVTCLHLFYLFLLFLRFLCYSFLAFQTCFLFGWPPFYALCCC